MQVSYQDLHDTLRRALVTAGLDGDRAALCARLIGNFLKQRGVAVTEIKLKDMGVPANPQADPAEAAKSILAALHATQQ